jgi:hypothetical protein
MQIKLLLVSLCFDIYAACQRKAKNAYRKKKGYHYKSPCCKLKRTEEMSTSQIPSSPAQSNPALIIILRKSHSTLRSSRNNPRVVVNIVSCRRSIRHIIQSPARRNSCRSPSRARTPCAVETTHDFRPGLSHVLDSTAGADLSSRHLARIICILVPAHLHVHSHVCRLSECPAAGYAVALAKADEACPLAAEIAIGVGV